VCNEPSAPTVQPKTNVTQWLRPYSTSIRTLAIRAAEQAAITAVVERRVQEALRRPVAGHSLGGGTPSSGAAGSGGPAGSAVVSSAGRSGGGVLAAVRGSQGGDAGDGTPRSGSGSTAGGAGVEGRETERVAQWRAAWSDVLSGGQSGGEVADGSHASAGSGGGGPRTPTGYVQAQAMLAAGAKAAGAAYNTYEGFVEPLPPAAASARGVGHRDATDAAAHDGSNLPLRVARGEASDSSAGRPPIGDVMPDSASSGALHSYFNAYLEGRRAAGLGSPPAVYPGSHGSVSGGEHAAPVLPHPQSANGVTLGLAPRPGGGYLAPAPSFRVSRTPSGASSIALLAASAGASTSGGGGGGGDDGWDGAAVGGAEDGRTVGSLASTMYPEVYDSLPAMDEKTFDVIARHTAIANSKKMGYADPRPDIRPSQVLMPVAGAGRSNVLAHVEPRQALDVQHNPIGLQGKADAVFASQLRAGLHSSTVDPKAPRTGEAVKTMWGAGGTAPSEATVGYSYRHAAAASMLGDAGTVFDRLTDVRGYTGTHRHRFGNDGRGKGLAGRDDSFDYGYLVGSVAVEQHEGAAVMPTLHGLLDHGPGGAAKRLG